MKSGKTADIGPAKELVTKTPEETERVGMELSGFVTVPGVVLLRGALGTGKTTLTRGIARGLGIIDPDSVHSPSFTLVNIYEGSCPIYHVDLYRLKDERDLYMTGMDDFMGREGVTIVEWGERLGAVPPQAIVVDIKDAGGDTRKLRICSPAKRQIRRKRAGN
jgi:tRNA threonylcarbamoyladenosine biosynthesis protein TsaE